MSNVTHSCQLPLHGYGGFGKCLDTLDHARLPELMKRERDVSSFFFSRQLVLLLLDAIYGVLLKYGENQQERWLELLFPGFSYHKKIRWTGNVVKLREGMSSVCIPVFSVGVESQEFRFLFLFDVGNPSKIEKKLLFEKRRNKFVQQPLFFFFWSNLFLKQT